MSDQTIPGVDPSADLPGEGAAIEQTGAPRFPEIERRILDSWAADGTFAASLDARRGSAAGEFVFYDGPPFANGLPHYGHLLTGYVKDVVPRYKTMRGHLVDRRFGWDTHGLPAEVEAERQLGITHKSEIEQMGIATFNDACRTSVLKYTAEWEEYVTRQARWVDFENDYKTLDTDYMESVMWAFKTLWDKGLVYEGFRVLAYCWRCETPLSNSETRMDDTYRNRQDPAVTVGFPLLGDGSPDDELAGVLALIWTTTPWTLPSNLAMAVHPDLDYVVVAGSGEHEGRRFLLAEARVGHYARELGEDAADRVVSRHRGADLLGRRYTPPFQLGRFSSEVVTNESGEAGLADNWRILNAPFVTTDSGTGIVHMAPAFGEDDFNVCQLNGIHPVVTVDATGRFNELVPDFAGQHVFDANKEINRALRDGVPSGALLLRLESYDHPYPHCWRCGNALIYRAVSSWFVAVTQIRDRMVELNQEITWVPGHVKDGSFGKWLEGARDWSISRNRYWGSPIPVWTSDDPTYPRVDVYGSLDDLERDFGVRPADLHRPHVDELTRPNPDDPTGRSTMRRVPEVLDCWFESGSMPFAQVHYPFENADWFEDHYPGDFIVEYIGQTRGWFYTLHVLATALFDRPAFRTCVSHGILLGDDGRKMSKSLRNYPAVSEVLDRDGADAMRWFLMSSPVLRGGNLIVTEQGIRDSVRQVLLPLWNTFQFFQLYTGSSSHTPRWRTSSPDVLDRYVLAKLHDTVVATTTQLDEYDIAGACESVRQFLDVLTNWYVRRSRSAFWDGESERAQAAFDTLHTVLETVSRLLAPLLPLVSEEIWRALTGGRSVHLTDWPDAVDLPADPDLVQAMDRARQVCSVASSLRKGAGLRTRLPLARLEVFDEAFGELEPFADLIADELNVRAVSLAPPSGAAEFGVHERVTVNARAAGPRLGKDVQTVIRAAKAGDWEERPDGTVVAGGIALQAGEYERELVFEGGQEGRATGLLDGGGFAVLDTEVTPELAAEGVARDVIRLVQQARRDAGLQISDRIRLTVAADGPVWQALVSHQNLVVSETLAQQFGSSASAEALPEESATLVGTVEGHQVRVAVERTDQR